MADNRNAMPFVDRVLRAAYMRACDVLYHRAAGSYDWVSWGVSAGAWDAWRRVALSAALEITGGEPMPMLELGFGTGDLLMAAHQAGQTIVGLELSPDMHRVADRKLTTARLCVPRVRATALAMPFTSATFAAVLSTFPSGYILERETLTECARVLCPGGRLLIAGLWVTPVVAGQPLKLPLLYGEPSAAQLAEIRRRIECAGLSVELSARRAAGADVALLVGSKH